MKILEKYIVRENLKPFIISLLVLTSLFIIDLLISKMSLMIEKKLSLSTIAQIFLYSLPSMVALTIPMSILFATIIAFGRLSVDNELVAIRSCGVNIYSLLRPMFFLMILLSGAMLYFNHSILPQSNYRFRNLLIQAAHRNPITNIEPGIFNKSNTYSKLVIYAKDRTQEELQGIVIYNKGDRDVSQTITAKSGTIDLKDGGNNLFATLYNGEIHEKDNKNIENYRVIKFKTFDFDLIGSTQRGDVQHEISDREMTTTMMRQKIQANRQELAEANKNRQIYVDRLASLNESSLDITKENEIKKLTLLLEQTQYTIGQLKRTNSSYLVEINKKNAIAFAIIIFMMLGIPVGLATKTSGVGMAFGFSAVIFIIYHSTLIAGEQLADRGLISPILAMWFANIILLIFAIFMIQESSKEVNTFDIQKQKLAALFVRRKSENPR